MKILMCYPFAVLCLVFCFYAKMLNAEDLYLDLGVSLSDNLSLRAAAGISITERWSLQMDGDLLELDPFFISGVYDFTEFLYATLGLSILGTTYTRGAMGYKFLLFDNIYAKFEAAYYMNLEEFDDKFAGIRAFISFKFS